MRYFLVVMVDNVHNEPGGRFGSTARFIRESVKVFEVAAYDPSAFSLPVVVIDQHIQFLSDPFISRDIASFSSH